MIWIIGLFISIVGTIVFGCLWFSGATPDSYCDCIAKNYDSPEAIQQLAEENPEKFKRYNRMFIRRFIFGIITLLLVLGIAVCGCGVFISSRISG